MTNSRPDRTPPSAYRPTRSAPSTTTARTRPSSSSARPRRKATRPQPRRPTRTSGRPTDGGSGQGDVDGEHGVQSAPGDDRGDAEPSLEAQGPVGDDAAGEAQDRGEDAEPIEVPARERKAD